MPGRSIVTRRSSMKGYMERDRIPVTDYFYRKKDTCYTIQISYDEFMRFCAFHKKLFELHLKELMEIMHVVAFSDTNTIVTIHYPSDVRPRFGGMFHTLRNDKVIDADDDVYTVITDLSECYTDGGNMRDELDRFEKEVNDAYSELCDGLDGIENSEIVMDGHMVNVPIDDYVMFMRYEDMYREQLIMINECRRCDKAIAEYCEKTFGIKEKRQAFNHAADNAGKMNVIIRSTRPDNG